MKYCVLPEWHTHYTYSLAHMCMHTHTHVPTPNQVLSDHYAFGLAQMLMFHYNKDTQWAISAFPQVAFQRPETSFREPNFLSSPQTFFLGPWSQATPLCASEKILLDPFATWVTGNLTGQPSRWPLSQAVIGGHDPKQELCVRGLLISDSLAYKGSWNVPGTPSPPQCAPLPHVLRFSHCLVTLLDPPRPPTALSCSVFLFIHPWGCPDTSGKLITLLITYCCVPPSTGHRSSVLMSGDLK